MPKAEKSRKSFKINEGASTSTGRKSYKINKGASTSKELVSKFVAVAEENDKFAKEPPTIFVQCEKCKKWRQARQYFEQKEVPQYWECQMWVKDGQIGSCDTPGSTDEPDIEQEFFPEGTVVWAKLGKYKPWPAMIESDPNQMESKRNTAKGLQQYNVTFFGTKRSRQWIFESNLKAYEQTDPTNIKEKSLKRAIEQANEAVATNFSIRIKKYSLASPLVKKYKKAKTIDGHLENGSNTEEEKAHFEDGHLENGNQAQEEEAHLEGIDFMRAQAEEKEVTKAFGPVFKKLKEDHPELIGKDNPNRYQDAFLAMLDIYMPPYKKHS